MKKRLFGVTMCNPLNPAAVVHFELVQGYIKTYQTAAGAKITFGFNFDRAGWHITEVSTGAELKPPFPFDQRLKLAFAKQVAKQNADFLAQKLSKNLPLIVQQQKQLADYALQYRLAAHTRPQAKEKPPDNKKLLASEQNGLATPKNTPLIKGGD